MIYKPFTNKSTSIIIEDIRESLKEDLPDQIIIDTGDLPHLIGEIERLNKENSDLQNIANIETSKNEYLEQEIERQKEIIRQLDIKNLELTTTLKEVRECLNKNRVYITGERNLAFEIEEILDKEKE